MIEVNEIDQKSRYRGRNRSGRVIKVKEIKGNGQDIPLQCTPPSRAKYDERRSNEINLGPHKSTSALRPTILCDAYTPSHP